MPPKQYRCPDCNRIIDTTEHSATGTIRCRHCGTKVKLPTPPPPLDPRDGPLPPETQ